MMKKIEKEEEDISYEDPDRKLYHLCIVNLVIGTLYCAKGNYEFGISQIMKSLEPYSKKLGTDTWFYAKRCFCSLVENMAMQHMIMLKDVIGQEIIQFLEHCEAYGHNVPTAVEQPLQEHTLHGRCNTVFTNLDYLGSSGVVLSVEQQATLQSSLVVLRREHKFRRVKLWGIILGINKDYFIAQGVSTDELNSHL